MNNLTLLETIFIWYIIVVNVLGIVNIIVRDEKSKKISDSLLFGIMLIATLITMPFVVYYTHVKIEGHIREKDLEKKHDELFNNKGEDDE